MLILDPTTNKIIEHINKANHKAYIVGGAIRDSVLGIKYNDIDLAVDGSIEEIKEIFKDYNIKSYKKGHTIGVVFENKYFEVSSLNENNLNKDLKNRDFTINSMAMINDNVIDPYNGLGDIKNRVIRTIIDPKEAILHDPIRILRAIRFNACLHFDIEKKLEDVIHKNYELLDNVSVERITNELNKILLVRRPSKTILRYFDVFCYLFPKLRNIKDFLQHSKYHHLDVLNHTLLVLDSTEPILELRYIALFHDIAKPECFSLDDKGQGHFYNHGLKSAFVAKEYLDKYRYSNEFVIKVTKIITHHDFQFVNNNSILKFLNLFGNKDLDLYFKFRRADILGQNPTLFDRIDTINRIENLTKDLALNSVYKVTDLSVKGNDIKALGYEKEKIAIILEQLLKAFIDGKVTNKKEDLINYLNNNHLGDDIYE